MSYIRDFEAELNKTSESIIRWVSERLLESYRNGITYGQNGGTVKRQGQSRRKGSFDKTESSPVFAFVQSKNASCDDVALAK